MAEWPARVNGPKTTAGRAALEARLDEVEEELLDSPSGRINGGEAFDPLRRLDIGGRIPEALGKERRGRADGGEARLEDELLLRAEGQAIAFADLLRKEPCGHRAIPAHDGPCGRTLAIEEEIRHLARGLADGDHIGVQRLFEINLEGFIILRKHIERDAEESREGLRLFIIARLLLVAQLAHHHLMRGQRAIEERCVDPEERFDVERMIGVVALEAADVLVDEAFNAVVNMEDLPRLRHRELEIAKDDPVD